MAIVSVNQRLDDLFCITIDLMVQQSRFVLLLLHFECTTPYSCLFEELVGCGMDLLLLDESSLENGLLH